MRKDLPVKFSTLSTAIRPVVAALALSVAFWSPASAAGPAIFADTNGNGVFDAGDVDLTVTLKADGKVDTPYSIVVPEGAVVRLTMDGSFHAGQGIHVAGTVSGSGSLFFRTESGPITVGPRSTVTAYGVLQMTAGTDLMIDNSRVQSYDTAMLESLDGNIVVNKGILYGVNRLDLNGFAPAGLLKIDGTTLQAPRGLINLHVEGTIEVEQAKFSSLDFNATVAGGAAEICWSSVRVASRTGSVSVSVESVPPSAGLSATGSYLDLTGTKMYASPQNVVVSADQLVGY